VSDAEWFFVWGLARELLARARAWWACADERQRVALAGPLRQLAADVNLLTPTFAPESPADLRAELPEARAAFVDSSRAAAAAVLANCKARADPSVSTWDAAARLAYALGLVDTDLALKPLLEGPADTRVSGRDGPPATG